MDVMQVKVRKRGSEAVPAKRLRAAAPELQELRFGDPRRREVGELVHGLINKDPECFRKYQSDFVSVFELEARYRVAAALRGGRTVGGCAFYRLPRGAYVEFIGAERGSHAGTLLLDLVRQEVRESPSLHFVCLNAIRPCRSDPASLHSFAWYLGKGFTPVDQEPVLQLLTQVLTPTASTILTVKALHSRFKVPTPAAGTIAMIWIRCPERLD